MPDFRKKPINTVKRLPDRGLYDKETIYSILDEGLICHVGIVQDGQPIVIPTIHVRMDDQVILHGSPGSRLLKTTRLGSPVCITVTHLDGLVLARSALHHSMNYRSVVLFGRGLEIKDHGEKMRALHSLVEHLVPGRWKDIRQPSEKELAMTMVVSVPIDEASAKIRTGPAVDEEQDYKIPTWAGVIPLKLTPSSAEPDSKLVDGVSTPPYVINYRRP